MTDKEWYARTYFGLPAEQIKFFWELTEAQQAEVECHFGLVQAATFVYAVKQSNGMVVRRVKRDLTVEAQAQWGVSDR